MCLMPSSRKSYITYPTSFSTTISLFTLKLFLRGLHDVETLWFILDFHKKSGHTHRGEALYFELYVVLALVQKSRSLRRMSFVAYLGAAWCIVFVIGRLCLRWGLFQSCVPLRVWYGCNHARRSVSNATRQCGFVLKFQSTEAGAHLSLPMGRWISASKLKL